MQKRGVPVKQVLPKAQQKPTSAKGSSQIKRLKSKRGSVIQTEVDEPNEVAPSSIFEGQFRVQPGKLEAIVAIPTTDKFLKETYEKLRQLEEDIQNRKAKEAILMS